VEARQAAGVGAVALTVVYLVGTLLAGLSAAWAGSAGALALLRTVHMRTAGRVRGVR
jgi:hypothetical protein